MMTSSAADLTIETKQKGPALFKLGADLVANDYKLNSKGEVELPTQ